MPTKVKDRFLMGASWVVCEFFQEVWIADFAWVSRQNLA